MAKDNSRNKPLILVELFFLRDQYFRRGIGRYGIEIAKRLLQLNRDNFRIEAIGMGLEADSIKNLGLNPSEIRFDKFHSIGDPHNSTPVHNLSDYTFKIRPLIKRLSPSVYIASHFERGLPTDLCPVTVAIHDVIPLATGSYSKKGAIVNYLKGAYYKKMFSDVKDAKAIFTSSKFSKQDLITIGKLPEEKISTVYLGVSEVFRDGNIKIPDISEVAAKFFGSIQVPSYLIYDGGFEQNKNTTQLIEVWAEIKKHLPHIKLVVTGGDFLIDLRNNLMTSYTPVNERSEALVLDAKDYGVLEDLIPVGKVSESDLAILTSLAKAYINLSSYEGFGFGPIQAMAAGTPAIVTNGSSFKEVAGPAAMLVNLDSWKNQIPQMIQVLTEENTRKSMIDAGLVHSRNFNWDNTFAETWKVISQDL